MTPRPPLDDKHDGPKEAIGIGADERSNLTVHNGTIASRRHGVDIQGNGQTNTSDVNPRVENLRATNSTTNGILLVSAPGGQVANSRVLQTGDAAQDGAAGILASGAETLIKNNGVDTVLIAENQAVGICVNDGGSFVRSNAISHSFYASSAASTKTI